MMDRLPIESVIDKIKGGLTEGRMVQLFWHRRDLEKRRKFRSRSSLTLYSVHKNFTVRAAPNRRAGSGVLDVAFAWRKSPRQSWISNAPGIMRIERHAH